MVGSGADSNFSCSRTETDRQVCSIGLVFQVQGVFGADDPEVLGTERVMKSQPQLLRLSS